MRIYDKNKKLIKTVCNQCGDMQESAGGLELKEYFHGEMAWGYFSNKDGEIHQFDLCEQCYDRLIAGFSFPVQMEEATELV